MNKTLKWAPRIFAWLAFATASPLQGNVLLNPGFESDLPGESENIPGWNLYGANTYNETGPTAHSGSNYFKVYQAFTGAVNDDGIYQDYISGPGATYTANGWAQTVSGDALAGQNMAWIEITFRDARGNMLALYRSGLITTNALATGAFPENTWVNLPVTNQYNPTTLLVTNTVAALVAPPGTYFVRCQLVFQGDAAGSAGSLYFDDISLTLAGAAPYGNWNITWDDEFNGATINTNTWTYDIGNGSSGWGNNELEYYTSNAANASVSNGYLTIAALEQSTGGFSFTSARMKTEGLVSWLYGRFEWRVQLPAGTGFWPALWFLGTNINTVGWPECGEIDVMENNGSDLANVQGSLHSGSDETSVFTFINNQSVTGFHVYDLDWASNSFIWYVDGNLYEMQTNWWSDTGNPYPAPFNRPAFMLMNLAVGGNYVGNPSVSQIEAGGGFPGKMLVDYARVYNVTGPLTLSVTRSNNSFVLSWPGNIVAHLQMQTLPLHGSVTTNWSNVTQSTNPYVVSPASTGVIYRLESP